MYARTAPFSLQARYQMSFSPAITFLDKEYSSPILGASGTFGNGDIYKDLLNYSKIGGFVTKAVTAQPRAGNPGQRIFETSGGVLNSIGLENDGLANFIEQKLPEFEKYDCHIWVNVSGNSPEEYINIIETIGEHDFIAGFEINVSCPNVAHGGMRFGASADQVRSLTSRIRVRTNKPITIKLNPNVIDIVEIAKAAKDGKAHAITVSNTFLGMEIDVHKKQPVLGNVTGGYSGKPIFPLALRCVWQIRKEIDIPIIGCGGITSGLDGIKMLMAGASLLQVGTSTLKNPRALEDISNEMSDWAEKNGYSSFSEIIGVAQKND